MLIPSELSKGIAAAQSEGDAPAPELTVLQFFKEHLAQIVGTIIFCGTLLAVWILTARK
jgi:hypothetical protein